MVDDSALQLARCLRGFSIAIVILGVGAAFYLFQATTSAPVDASGYLAIGALWLTNLVSMLLNGMYWLIRRRPRWLVVTMLIQAAICVIALIALVVPDTFFS